MHPSYPNIEYEVNDIVLSPDMDDVKHPELQLDYEIPLFEVQFGGDDLQRLNDDLEEISKDMYERFVDETIPPEERQFDGQYSLTYYHDMWNFFYIDDPAVEALFFLLKTAHDDICERLGITDLNFSTHTWANCFRKGNATNINSHRHLNAPAVSHLASNYSVTADSETATVMELPDADDIFRVENKPGQLIFFPIWIGHYSEKVSREDHTRITIPTNIHVYEDEGEIGSHYIPFDLPPNFKKDSTGQSFDQMPHIDKETLEYVNLPLDEALSGPPFKLDHRFKQR